MMSEWKRKIISHLQYFLVPAIIFWRCNWHPWYARCQGSKKHSKVEFDGSQFRTIGRMGHFLHRMEKRLQLLGGFCYTVSSSSYPGFGLGCTFWFLGGTTHMGGVVLHPPWEYLEGRTYTCIETQDVFLVLFRSLFVFTVFLGGNVFIYVFILTHRCSSQHTPAGRTFQHKHVKTCWKDSQILRIIEH